MFGKSFSLNDEDAYSQASRALDRGQALEALKGARELARRGYPPADFLIGMIFEFGGPQVQIDLEKAVHHYKRAAYLNRNAVTLGYCARSLMKLGPEHYGVARRYIEDMEAFGTSPELILAWAWFHETSPQPDFRKASSYYVRAALRGRFLGFFGYSRVSRRMGRHVRALACDVVRLLTGWLIFLVIGRRARYFF